MYVLVVLLCGAYSPGMEVTRKSYEGRCGRRLQGGGA